MHDNPTSTANIAFLGGGNMAEALIGGMRKTASAGGFAPKIAVAEPDEQRRKLLSDKHGCDVYPDAEALFAANTQPETLVLAVKPQVLPDALAAIAQLELPPLLISIAAGVPIAAIRQASGDASIAVIRAMPNTPALVGEGVSGLVGSDNASDTQRQLAENILGAVGPLCWVNSEAALDAVTAISGSGPAYYFLFTEALIEAAQSLGLDADTATLLATQTALGAGTLMSKSDVDAVELRRRVTSPGGTTEQAILSFENDGLRDLVKKAATAAARRAAELANPKSN